MEKPTKNDCEIEEKSVLATKGVGGGTIFGSCSECPLLFKKKKTLLMTVLTETGLGPVVSREFPRPASVISALDEVVPGHVIEHVFTVA